ncbi:MAG: PEP/pyruvate-binding domain-containing protein [Candidatus Magasanikbacteria bacterium]|jgi:pyruvate,water dikinase
MSHIKFFKQISKADVAIAGGKGASLGEMTQAKIPVPPGFVILAGAFDRFLTETGLNQEIKARLKEVSLDDTNSIDKASNVIRDVIHDRPFPKDLAKEILDAYDKLISSDNKKILRVAQDDRCLVAVRSSATAEDGAVASWAGELETYLNTSKKDLIVRVRECWSSLFTSRAIFYRHEKKLIDHDVSVAVVVQAMIQSEISGIAFTVHPVTEDPNQMIIEAGYGLGEAIVSGQITPDSYVIGKKDLNIIDISIGEQTRQLVKLKSKNADGESNGWVELGPEGVKQKLSEKQIIALAKICQKIENHYGFPCDIEWAFAGGKFYITQSRPITTLKK